jgi:hypothetical protein
MRLSINLAATEQKEMYVHLNVPVSSFREIYPYLYEKDYFMTNDIAFFF